MISKRLPRKLNASADSRVSEPTDMRDALNVSSSEDFRGEDDGSTGNAGVLKPVKSNVELGSTLFSGGNKLRVIGKAICNKHNVCYFFVVDSDEPSNSGIYAYDPDIYFKGEGRLSDDIIKIYTSESFGFSADGFVKADLVYVQRRFEDFDSSPFIFFTDNKTEPKKLNVLRAYYESGVSDYEGDNEKDFITACPVTPSMPPTSSFSGSEDLTNEFVNINGFQFAYQLVYKDGNESAISSYSDIAVPSEYVNQGTDSIVDVTAFNQCEITIPSDHITSEVETVRIIARRGNNGAWQNIHEEEGVSGGFTFLFKNNTVDGSVPSEDLAKQFTNLPKKAQAQTVIGNRLMYGNYTEGFDSVPVAGTIDAVYSDRPLDGISYTIKVEEATCLSELDAFLYNQRLKLLAQHPANHAPTNRIFHQGKTVNKNAAFKINVGDNALPTFTPVGRVINMSFSFRPQSNYHIYQARNNAGYHANNHLGDYFGPEFNPPTGAAAVDAFDQRTRFMLTKDQSGCRNGNWFDGADTSDPKGSVHGFDLLGENLPDIQQPPDYVGTGYKLVRQLTPSVIPDTNFGLGWRGWSEIDPQQRKADPAIGIGTSAYAPLIVPTEELVSIPVSFKIDLVEGQGVEQVHRRDISKAIAFYLSTGSIPHDPLHNNSEVFLDEVFVPQVNDQFDENGWFHELNIDRGLQNGQSFSPLGSFAKTISLCGRRDSGIDEHVNGESQEGDARGSSAFTINKATVKFRFFRDVLYKQEESGHLGKLLAGEGHDGPNERVGLFVESIKDVEVKTCVRNMSVDARWFVFNDARPDLSHTFDDKETYAGLNMDPREVFGTGDPADGFNQSAPYFHCLGRLSSRVMNPSSGVAPDGQSDFIEEMFNGLYDVPANLFDATKWHPDEVSLTTVTLDPSPGEVSAFTVLDGAYFGKGTVGSVGVENSTNNHDSFPVTTSVFDGNGSTDAAHLFGGYLLGTAPQVPGYQNGQPRYASPMRGSHIDQSWLTLAGVLNNLAGNDNFQASQQMGAYNVYPAITVLNEWTNFSVFGASATNWWMGRKLQSAEVVSSSADLGFESVTGLRSFKSSASHGFGVVYYDERGRASDVNRLGSMYVNPYYNRGENQQGAVGARITLSNDPPEWAKYFHIVYTGNTSYSDFIQYTSGGAFAVENTSSDEAGNIFVSLNYLQDNPEVSYTSQFGARNVDGSDVMYTPLSGDILRIISYYDENGQRVFPSEDLSFEVVGFRKLNASSDNPFFNETIEEGVPAPLTGSFVVLRDNPNALGFSYNDVIGAENQPSTLEHKWNNRTVIEIVRPALVEDEENQVFYESSNVFPIDQHGNELTITNGDVWFRKVPMNFPIKNSENIYLNLINNDGSGSPKFTDYYLETKAFNDKVRNADVWGKGKIKIINPEAHEVRRESSITFSDQNNPASKFLRLTSFSPAQLQFKDMPGEHGPINYLCNQEDSVLSIQKNKVASVPFNRNILSTAAGQDSLTASSLVLGSPRFYAGAYGCDDNPESVCEINGIVYFASKSNAEVYRFTPSSGVQVISDVGMKSFFRRLFQKAAEEAEAKGPVRVVGGYDPLNKEFLLSVYNLNDGVDPEEVIDEPDTEVDEDSGTDPSSGGGQEDDFPDVAGDGTPIEITPTGVTIPVSTILSSLSTAERADFNNDGVVSVNDLLDLLTVFEDQTSIINANRNFTQEDDDLTFEYE